MGLLRGARAVQSNAEECKSMVSRFFLFFSTHKSFLRFLQLFEANLSFVITNTYVFVSRKAFEELGRALRAAFVTDDVRWATDGLHRVYLGYSSTRIRELEAVYSGAQKTALRDAAMGGADDPLGDAAVVGAARAEGLLSPELGMREWCSKFAKAVQKHGTASLFETDPEVFLRRALETMNEQKTMSDCATQTYTTGKRLYNDFERFRLIPNKKVRKSMEKHEYNRCRDQS